MNSTLQASAQPMATGQPDFDVAVIGSGFSGLGMAIKLKHDGMHAFVVLEKAQQIGGTWRENTYPRAIARRPA
jgi:cation diffusion facilitator CzcD-associated flavoprotein CzcO